MSVVTLAFKCSVIGANGQVDPNSHKFLTWSYFVHEDVITKTKTFSQYGNSLAQRVLGFYPHLTGEATKIVYVDENNDRIAIPSDKVLETTPVLKVIYKGDLEEQRSPIRIFIQLVSPSAPATGNCSCTVHRDLHCSICKAKLKNEFVYKCLQCESDFTLCKHCETTGKHSEHVVIRFIAGQPNCLPEMKQLVHSAARSFGC